MSRSDDDEGSVALEILRTVTPSYTGRRDREMNLIGWGYFLGLIVILLPFLPVLVVLWLLTKLLDRLIPGET